ncbi:MAG: TonB-dependent receptor [Lysobacter sp.]
MKKRNRNILASAIVVILSNAALVSTSFAQSAEKVDGQEVSAGQEASISDPSVESKEAVQLKAVKVTSRRIEEMAQDVPLPVTVVSAETIANKGFEDIQDIARFTPGFTFHQGFGRTLDRPIIRGQVNIQGEANASFFIDGVFVDGDISGYDLSGVDRVEVIRGPQSALFGRRTFSGAVNYITKPPSGKHEGGATLQLGNYGQRQARVNYSGPLTETLSFRVNAYRDQRDGMYHNTISGKDDLGGRKTTSYGGSLFWNPSSSFSATLRANYQQSDDQAPAFHRFSLADANCFGTNTGNIYAGTPLYTGRTYNCGKLKVPDQFALSTPSFDLAGYKAGVTTSALRASLALTYYFENGWEANSTTAYNTVKEYLGIDQDFSGSRTFGGAYETFSSQPAHDFAQEFRLSSDQTRPLRGMVGAYMYNQGNGHGYAGDLSGFNLSPGQANNKISPVLTSPLTPSATVEYRAIFGLLEYQFNDSWKASAELRRGQDKIGATGVDNKRLAIGGVSTPVSRAYSSSSTFKSTLPRFTVNYKMHDGLSFYGLAAKGNKPGGYNVSIEDARITDASRASLISQGFGQFDEETAWTTELGMKSMWLDNRLRINADVFNIDWKNQQLTTNAITTWTNGQTSSQSFTSNAGKSRIRGFEVEGEYLVSREWLVNFSYAHLNTKILDSYDPDFLNYIGSSNAKGNRLPAVPADTATVGVTYNGRLSNGWGLFGNADVDYESSRYGDAMNVNWTGAATTMNFRVGIEPVDRLRITAYVKNAFNDDTPEDILRYIDPDVLIAYPNMVSGTGYSQNYPRAAVVTARMPRMFGVTVDYRF